MIKDIQEYKEWCLDTWSGKRKRMRSILGLVGEAGEVAEKFKKFCREDYSYGEFIEALKYELGDVLYYLVICAHEHNIEIEDIMTSNIDKLQSRKKRNKIKGSGDKR